MVSLAHHHHFAANHERSIFWSDQAAGRARRQGAYREAMRLLDQCLEAAERLPSPLPARAGAATDRRLPDPRIRWRRLKAEAAGAVGDGQTRKREAELAIALTGARSARRPFVRAIAGAASLLRRSVVGKPERLVQAAEGEPTEAAVSEPEGTVHPLEVYRELARAHRQLAVGAYFLGHAVEIAYNTSRALAYAERVGRSPELADCLASVGMMYGLTGFAEAARRHLSAARTLANDLGDETAIAYAEVSSALFSVGQGDWESVRQQTERCQQISKRTGDTSYWGYGQALRFWMHHYRGEVDEADRCAERALGGGARGGQPPAPVLGRPLPRPGMQPAGATGPRPASASRPPARSTTRRRRRAASCARSTSCNRSSPTWAPPSTSWAIRAEAHTLEDTALRELGSARRPAGHAILEGCSSIAHLELAALAEKPSADRLARVHRTLTLLRRYCSIFPIGRPRLAFWHGRLLALTDRRTPALATWRAGLATARALGMKYDETLLAAAIEGSPRST